MSKNQRYLTIYKFNAKFIATVLFNYLKSQSGMMGASVSDSQLHDFAHAMVAEAMNNQVKAIA